MSLLGLVDTAINKTQFNKLSEYITFCRSYLEFIETGLQAKIVSQNETHYQFYQYGKEGGFNISRPMNSQLMCNINEFEGIIVQFKSVLEQLKAGERPSDDLRKSFIRTIYTLQQSIGGTLDALPSGKSNQARKINGDLFERLVRLLLVDLGLDCVSGTMQIPIKDNEGVEILKSSYQHDLLISSENELKVIGSVKTSSKDRIDKVFLDKFLYNRLTETTLPHIAIFLNDVQRKKTKKENVYGINSTFLSGHFKAYTIKLNPLDGVYYCDIRPNMVADPFLANHIKTIDHLFYSDIWALLSKKGQSLEEVEIKPGEGEDVIVEAPVIKVP